VVEAVGRYWSFFKYSLADLRGSMLTDDTPCWVGILIGAAEHWISLSAPSWSHCHSPVKIKVT
jgi:hypothetical protein